MPYVIEVKNPIEVSDSRIIDVVEKGTPAALYAKEGAHYYLNGNKVEKLDFLLEEDDHLLIITEPQDPIVGTLLSIAAAIGAGAAISAGAYLLAAVIIGGYIFISMTLFQPDRPSTLPEPTVSENYSWQPHTTQKQGIPVPVIYGTHKTNGNVIQADLYSIAGKNYLRMIIALSEGPVANISQERIKINDRAITEYSSVTWTSRHGYLDQTPTALRGATEDLISTPIELRKDATHTITVNPSATSYSSIALHFNFPNGLCYYNDQGGVSSMTVEFDIQVKLDGQWTGAHSAAQYSIKVNNTSVNKWNLVRVRTYTVWEERYDYLGEWYYSAPVEKQAVEYIHTATTKPAFIGNYEANVRYDCTEEQAIAWLNQVGGYSKLSLIGGDCKFYFIYEKKEVVLTYTEPGKVKITGASSTAYQATVFIDKPQSSTITEVKIKRLTEDYDLKNHPRVRSISYLQEARVEYKFNLEYPNLAYLDVEGVAVEDFNSRINVDAIVSGKKVVIYNANGTPAQIEAFSNNPAWVCIDVLTQPVLRNREIVKYDGIHPSKLDMASFVEWAQYCDETIQYKDKNGTIRTAKRCTFNGVFDTSQSLWEQAIKVASMARAKLVPNLYSGKISVVIDKPANPNVPYVQVFNQGNIIADSMEVFYTSLDDRFDCFEVSYTNADAEYERDQLVVYAPNLETGRTERLDGFGITSTQEAYRFAMWHLLRQEYIRRFIRFKTAFEHLGCKPGDTVLVHHDIFGTCDSGRLEANCTTTTLYLDKKITASQGDKVIVRYANDSIGQSTLASNVNNSSIVSLATPLPTAPARFDLWVIGATADISRIYRITSISVNDDLSATIEAEEYRPEVYQCDSIDIKFPAEPTPKLRSIPMVTDLQVKPIFWIENKELKGALDISWNHPAPHLVANYEVVVNGEPKAKTKRKSYQQPIYIQKATYTVAVFAQPAVLLPPVASAPVAQVEVDPWTQFKPKVTHLALEGEPSSTVWDGDGFILTWALSSGDGDVLPLVFASSPQLEASYYELNFNTGSGIFYGAKGKTITCSTNNFSYKYKQANTADLDATIANTAENGTFLVRVRAYIDGYGFTDWTPRLKITRANPPAPKVQDSKFDANSAIVTFYLEPVPDPSIIATEYRYKVNDGQFSSWLTTDKNEIVIALSDAMKNVAQAYSVSIEIRYKDFCNLYSTTVGAAISGLWPKKILLVGGLEAMNIDSTGSSFNVVTSGQISCGATGYMQGSGLWAGLANGVAKFFVGNNDKYMAWDGATGNLTITGTINAAGGRLANWLIETNQISADSHRAVLNSETPFIKLGTISTYGGTGAGFWVGKHDGTYKLVIGDYNNNKYLAWDGSNLIYNGSLAQGIIALEHFASGIKPIKIVNQLPSSGEQGDVVFLTTNSKLYRWNGTSWTTAVPTTDISGQITTGQIADGAITEIKIGDDSISPAKIKAGAITEVKIAVNAVTVDKIADGAITEVKIADDSISAPKIKAEAITAAKIAAEAITADKIAANAVTADKIEANAITADKIATNAVIADKIAANAVVADKIAANAVTVDKIAANAVTANKIAAEAVTTDKIEAGAVTAAKIATSAITADKIAAEAITADKIAAGAITTDKIEAGAVTADKISVDSLSAISATLGEVYAGKIDVCNEGWFRGGKTSPYDWTNRGIWIGKFGNDYICHIGGPNVHFFASTSGGSILSNTVTLERLYVNNPTAGGIWFMEQPGKPAYRIYAHSIPRLIFEYFIPAEGYYMTLMLETTAIKAFKRLMCYEGIDVFNSNLEISGGKCFTNKLFEVKRASGDTEATVFRGESTRNVWSNGSGPTLNLTKNVYMATESYGYIGDIQFRLKRTYDEEIVLSSQISAYTPSTASGTGRIYFNMRTGLNQVQNKFYFNYDGRAYADEGWLTFSPDIKKDLGLTNPTPQDYLHWAIAEARKPNKPYEGIRDDDDPSQYAKDIAKIAIGVAKWAEWANNILKKLTKGGE